MRGARKIKTGGDPILLTKVSRCWINRLTPGNLLTGACLPGQARVPTLLTGYGLITNFGLAPAAGGGENTIVID